MHMSIRQPLERAIRAYLDETLGEADLRLAIGREAHDSRMFERWREREERVTDLASVVLESACRTYRG